VRPALLLSGLLALAGAHAAEPYVSGRVVGPDGTGIADAIVFVQSPADAPLGAGASPPHAEMDQINKTFVPGVLVVVAGTEVTFPNHDQIHHHVYSFSRTKSFELPLYKGQDAPPVLFDRSGVVKIGCNIHDWMSAVILVVPNHHYAATDAEGRFTLEEMPPGEYTLAAWHERSRVKVDDTLQKVQVAESEATVPALTFRIELMPARSRPAIHGQRKDP
jgi:plastocyanin